MTERNEFGLLIKSYQNFVCIGSNYPQEILSHYLWKKIMNKSTSRWKDMRKSFTRKSYQTM